MRGWVRILGLWCNRCLLHVDAQQITFGGSGKALTGRKLAAYRSRIGMVFQHFELFPHMTTLQNVMEAPVTVKRIDRRASADLARALPGAIAPQHRLTHAIDI